MIDLERAQRACTDAARVYKRRPAQDSLALLRRAGTNLAAVLRCAQLEPRTNMLEIDQHLRAGWGFYLLGAHLVEALPDNADDAHQALQRAEELDRRGRIETMSADAAIRRVTDLSRS